MTMINGVYIPVGFISWYRKKTNLKANFQAKEKLRSLKKSNLRNLVKQYQKKHGRYYAYRYY